MTWLFFFNPMCPRVSPQARGVKHIRPRLKRLDICFSHAGNYSISWVFVEQTPFFLFSTLRDSYVYFSFVRANQVARRTLNPHTRTDDDIYHLQ